MWSDALGRAAWRMEMRRLTMTQTTTDLTPDDLVAMYRLMLTGRRFTERALHWYTQGRLPQGLHPSIGQEAVGVGGC